MSSTEHDQVPDSKASEAAQPEVPQAAETASTSEPDGQVVEDSADELDESLDIEVDGAAEVVELTPLQALEEKVAALEASKAENYNKFLRASADLENVRKRSRRELRDGRIDERGRVLKDMLPVIDNLERAVEHATQNESEATKSIIEGVNLVLRQFHQALERYQVKGIEAVGKPFDPSMHDAVSQAPSADYPPGTVISVLQKGYMVEEKLLRPALAVVSIAMPEASEETVAASETESQASEEEGQSSSEESQEASDDKDAN